MTYNETIRNYLIYNHNVLNRAVKEVTHFESLRKSPETGSNMNWILGHILVSRNDMCSILQHQHICDEPIKKLYARGTNSNVDGPIDFKELLRIYNDTHESIMASTMAFDHSKDEKQTGTLTFLCFHEAYHIGQLGMLRRSLGKDGVAG